MNPKVLYKNAHRVFQIITLALFLCANVFAQEFKTVRDGIEYAEMTRVIDNAPVKINLLRLDLTKVRLDVVHAMDAAIGLEKTSSIVIRHGAFAAINGGFFRIDKSIWEGDETGALVIDGKMYSESYADRSALLIENNKKETKVSIHRLNLAVFGEIGNQEINVSGINRERKPDEIILYTPKFSRTTLTDSNGLEIVVRKKRIVKIFDQKGNIEIPPDGYILSANGKRREELLKLIKIGKKVDAGSPLPTTQIGGNKVFVLSPAEDIIGGVPQLISFGRINVTWQEEKSSKSFVETKHPRTAVAKLKDGKFLMVTVDGRSEASGGIGLEDLAEILLDLGAIDAMNLDGGGSSTMFLDGKIVNHPSDKEGERKVGDAILVTLRK